MIELELIAEKEMMKADEMVVFARSRSTRTENRGTKKNWG